MSRLFARLTWVAITIALAMGLASHAVAQQEPDLFELLLEMRIEGGPAREVVALVDGARLMVPLTVFLEVAEIGVQELQVGRRLVGSYPGDERFVFDTDSGVVIVGENEVPIGAGLAVWRGDELYVETGLLEWVFLIGIRRNLGELLFTVTESQGLPVVQRLEEERVVAVAPLPEPGGEEQGLIELLLEMRIDRGPSQDVFALADGTRVLVPLERFLTLAEIGVDTVRAGHRFTGIRYPAGARFVFDTDSSIVSMADRRSSLEPAQAEWRGETLYVDTGVLESVFSVRMQMNFSELMLAVWETKDLPVVQRLEREHRRMLYETGAPQRDADLYSIHRRPIDGAVLDWMLTSATDDPSRYTGLDLGLGAQVFGGSAILLHEEQRNDGASNRRTTGSWTRVWYDTPWLRQVRIGEVVGTGARPRGVQGAAVTNSPFVRPAEFAVAPLAGMFGPGWEVELYRGNQFLGYTTTDPTGRYRFDVPIRYGENPLDIVAFGPRGEVLTRRRTFAIDGARFPAKQFEYGVSAGGCAFSPCQAQANIDLRYGLNDKVTVRGGVDRFWRDSLADLWHPYASVAYQATRGLSLFAEGVGNALFAGRVEYAPSQDFNAGLGHTRFFGDAVDPLVGSAVLSHLTQASLLYRPPLWDYRAFGRLFVQHSGGDGRTRDLAGATITTRLGGARLDVGVTYDHVTAEPTFDQTRTVFDARYYHMYRGSLRWLRRTLLFAELGADPDSGLVLARGGFSRTLGGRFQLDMAVGWAEQRGATFDLGLTATLHAVRAVSTTQFAEQGTQGLLIAEGSVLWDGSGRRIEFSDGRSLGRAGIVGEVFLDVNGDGLAGPDEPRVPDVYVRVGPIASVTDHTGRFVVWDLVPFEAVIVEIDAQSIRNPLWLPVMEYFTFRPDPNAFSVIPVPLVQAGEVSGQVVIGPRETGARFVEVELHNLDTDDRYSVTTFSDGTFYLLGVRPGRYEATVSRQVLEELGAAVEPAQFSVGAAVEEAFVEGITIRLAER